MPPPSPPHLAEHFDPGQAVLDAIPLHVAVLDPSGAIIRINAAWNRFARENADAERAPWLYGVGANYLAVCDAAAGESAVGAAETAVGIRSLLAGEREEFSLEYPCHSPEQQRWFLMTASRLGAGADGVVVTHADITARKLAELAQRNSELRLQLALEATGDGLWDWDLRTGQAFLSAGYYAMTGYRREEVMADFAFFQSLVHPDDLPGVLATMSAHLRGETASSDIEYRMLTASGELRWIHGRGRVVERDAAGVPQRMTGHITDIGAQKRLELALRESEARYRAVVEDQTEMICRLKPDGTFLFANEVYCRLFGKTSAELLGSRWQPVAHPDDLPMIEARLAELSPDNPVVIIENRVYGGDGALHWMQFVNRAFFDERGNLLEIQAVGREITERKQIEARQQVLLLENTRLGRELIRLQEHERAALARELHDELSQQLVAIRAHAGAIRRHATVESRRNDARAIEKAAGQIYQVSHRLMESLHPRLLDSAGLGAATQALLTDWASRHPEVRLVPRLFGPLDGIAGEAGIHLFRILQESLANLAQHARARRARVALGIVTRRGRRMLRLVTRDDGIGFDAGIPHAGHGLLVMRERAHNQGGHFRLESCPGQGTRLLVEIPLPH